LILSALGCLISFVPKLRIPWLASRRKPTDTDNLLFYGDIAIYDPAGYLQALYKQCGAKDEALPIEKGYAQQIVMNSRIAMQKYEWFVISIYLTIGALFILTVAGIGYVTIKLL